MRKKARKYTLGESEFYTFSEIVLIIMALITIFPILLILVSSFTEEKTLLRDGYSIFPRVLSLDAYNAIFSQKDSIFNSYKITVIVTAVGTVLNVSMTLLFAYPLARKDFKYRNLFSFFVFFTMLFNGGIVPQYILYAKYLKINNTLWALIVPNRLMGAFNIFLVRNFFVNGVPESLIESAKIDGASEQKVFLSIMIPLSVPVIATVALFVGLAYWNDWINGLYYTSKASLFSLQLLLKKLLDNINFLTSGEARAILGSQVSLPTNSYKMALAVIGIVPILVVFPFVQKYLVRGTVIGAIKG